MASDPSGHGLPNSQARIGDTSGALFVLGAGVSRSSGIPIASELTTRLEHSLRPGVRAGPLLLGHGVLVNDWLASVLQIRVIDI